MHCYIDTLDNVHAALLTFCDGRYVGAILDRNGLRPSRFYVSKSNVMYMASEVGVANVEPADVTQKGRLKPGRLLLVDTQEGQFIRDEVIKEQIASLRPVANWIQKEVKVCCWVCWLTSMPDIPVCFICETVTS